MEVRIRKNESVENLIKRFSRKTKNAKIIDEYLERQHYKKPSEKRREAHFRKLRVIEKMKRKEAEKEARNR
jgi:ribosomal protein S21